MTISQPLTPISCVGKLIDKSHINKNVFQILYYLVDLQYKEDIGH